MAFVGKQKTLAKQELWREFRNVCDVCGVPSRRVPRWARAVDLPSGHGLSRVELEF